MPSISQTLLNLQQSLHKSAELSLHEATIEAQTILSFVTNLSRAELEINHKQILNRDSHQTISNILNERLQRVPLQYILEEAYFYGLRFYVNPSVLIPRPETEIMVEKAISILHHKQSINILEIGTGSGCISVALAAELKKAKASKLQIIATDISQQALSVAKKNAQTHSVEHLINFEHADLIPHDVISQHFDLLISNPPYIAEAEYSELTAEVHKEPKMALVGNKGNSGMNYYKEIADSPISYSDLLLEIDPKRAERIKAIYTNQNFSELSFIQDLSKTKRFLYGIKQN